MCLALPMRITAVDGLTATIAAEGLEQQASLMLVPQARVGDYVLVHAGYAISVLDETDARETIDLLVQMEAMGSDWPDETGPDASRRSGGDETPDEPA